MAVPLWKGSPLMKDGVQVGRVTQYTIIGFSVGKNIGYIGGDLGKGNTSDTVTINVYEAVLTEKQFL